MVTRALAKIAGAGRSDRAKKPPCTSHGPLPPAESPRALPVRAGAAFGVAPRFDEGDGRKERRWTAIFAADGVPKCRSIACNQRNRFDDFAELVSGSGGSTHYYT